jgi:hypothetical protein
MTAEIKANSSRGEIFGGPKHAASPMPKIMETKGIRQEVPKTTQNCAVRISESVTGNICQIENLFM